MAGMELRPGHPMKFNLEGGEFPVYDYGKDNEMADKKADTFTVPIASNQTLVVEARKAPATPADALRAAMSPAEVLARPHDYEAWYNGMREEALNG